MLQPRMPDSKQHWPLTAPHVIEPPRHASFAAPRGGRKKEGTDIQQEDSGAPMEEGWEM